MPQAGPYMKAWKNILLSVFLIIAGVLIALPVNEWRSRVAENDETHKCCL